MITATIALCGSADLEVGEDGAFVACDAERSERLARAVDEVTDAPDVDHRPVRPRLVEPPRQLGNHGLLLPIRGAFGQSARPPIPR